MLQKTVFMGIFLLIIFTKLPTKGGGGGDVGSSPKSSLMITTVRREVDQTLK